MTPEDGRDEGGRDGWEERAAHVLNAVMVMMMGLAIGGLGVLALWKFGGAVVSSGIGRDIDWWDLGYGAMFAVAGIQAIFYGVGMLRPGRKLVSSAGKDVR